MTSLNWIKIGSTHSITGADTTLHVVIQSDKSVVLYALTSLDFSNNSCQVLSESNLRIVISKAVDIKTAERTIAELHPEKYLQSLLEPECPFSVEDVIASHQNIMEWMVRNR